MRNKGCVWICFRFAGFLEVDGYGCRKAQRRSLIVWQHRESGNMGLEAVKRKLPYAELARDTNTGSARPPRLLSVRQVLERQQVSGWIWPRDSNRHEPPERTLIRGKGHR